MVERLPPFFRTTKIRAFLTCVAQGFQPCVLRSPEGLRHYNQIETALRRSSQRSQRPNSGSVRLEPDRGAIQPMARVTGRKLSKQMTLRQFDHGYWYATELKRFAHSLGIPSAHRLRKDELERAISRFLATGKVTSPTKRDLLHSGLEGCENHGLAQELPCVRSNPRPASVVGSF